MTLPLGFKARFVLLPALLLDGATPAFSTVEAYTACISMTAGLPFMLAEEGRQQWDMNPGSPATLAGLAAGTFSVGSEQ